MKTSEAVKGQRVKHTRTGEVCTVAYVYEDGTIGVNVGPMLSRHVLPAEEFEPHMEDEHARGH